MAAGYNSNVDSSDDLIGEAVIVLLKSGGPITISALLEQLTEMATSTDDNQRKQACLQSISEVKMSVGKHFNQRREHLEKQSTLLTPGIGPRYQTNDTKH